MIRQLISLTPDRSRPRLALYMTTVIAATVTRSVGCVVLVPLVRALFTDPTDAWPWVGALTVLIIGTWALELAASGAALNVGSELMHSLFERLADQLRVVPLGWFNRERTAAAQSTLSSVGQTVYSAMSNLVTPVVTASLTPYLIAVMLLLVSPPVALAALVGAPLLQGARWASGRLLRSADEDLLRLNLAVDQRVVEFATHQQVLRAFGRSGTEGSALDDAVSSQRRAGLRVLGWAVPGQLTFGLAYQAALLLLASVTVQQWSAGALTPAEVIAIFVVIVRYLEPFREISELAPAVETLRTIIAHTNMILDAPRLAVRPRAAQDQGTSDLALDGAAAAIEFRDVSFSYQDDDDTRTALDDVSFSVPVGSTTAIVGPSGSGKSTILALIARFHDVDSGAVLIGGSDIREVPPETLLDRMGIVTQDVYLFDGSIRSNITRSRPDATRTELEIAAELARVDEIVDRLADGWDTPVGEGGASLSGGERQRVSIARALLKEAPILLLDEATSAIDWENESAVLNAVRTGRNDTVRNNTGRTGGSGPPRTVVMVAHREQTIASADHIVFLDRGRVIEAGTRDQLVAIDGKFAAFWRDREAAADWILSRGTV